MRIKAKARHILKDHARERVISEIVKVLNDWRTSRFQFEASCRHGLRQGLVLSGHRWPLADLEAATLVSTALARIGARRPTWEQGQREFVDNDGVCVECARELDLTTSETWRFSFCSKECLDAKRAKSDQAFRYYGTHATKRAAYLVHKSRLPVIQCVRCRDTFAPSTRTSRFCSPECARLSRDDILKDRNCQSCGNIFHPPSATKTRYCSLACASIGRTVTLPRQCECCGEVFKPTKLSQRYCSRTCSSATLRAAQPEKSCLHCDEVFKPAGPKTVYCSPKCRNRANYEKTLLSKLDRCSSS